MNSPFAKSRLLRTALFAVVPACAALPAAAWADAVPSGYSCSGSCGALGANGVVTAPPSGASTYLYITTSESTASAPIPTGAVGGETNGSVLKTPVFSAASGAALDYNFNFVTSDGSQYSDYAWAELFKSDGTPDALLFDARTEPTGSIVPGYGLPTPVATLNPSSVDIMSGTTWSPLGNFSGACYAAGCGNTGWVASTYNISGAGDYYLAFGVTNELDQDYDTGLAVDGITVAGKPITPNVTPEPSSITLLGTGLAGAAGVLRRRRKLAQ